jgi:hypothetical protein
MTAAYGDALSHAMSQSRRIGGGRDPATDMARRRDIGRGLRLTARDPRR